MKTAASVAYNSDYNMHAVGQATITRPYTAEVVTHIWCFSWDFKKVYSQGVRMNKINHFSCSIQDILQ